ncbi:MAG TPA: hypothetical protein VMR33_20910 [Candidatus Baltobacteraceae bacterium]|nr:hypothetical protein [Candidatus Baltobacteraceae bacterium]
MKNRIIIAILIAPLLIAMTQTNDGASSPPADSATLARQARAFEQATEKIRSDCIQGRRIICGRILKIFPDGLVVESGYTNLMRPPLNKAWLIPGTAEATRQANLVEGKEPGCVCVGLVFLTALPRSRSSAKPKLYDYVVIQGYPAGRYTYTSVGTIQRTVRRFAAALPTAIRINRDIAGIKPPILRPAAAPDSK